MRHCCVPFCEKTTPRPKDRFCSAHRSQLTTDKVTPYKELPPIWAFQKCKIHGWQKRDHFYYHKQNNSYYCKPHTISKMKEKYCPIKRKAKLFREKHTNRNSAIKRIFGIDIKQYEKLLEKQDFKCAICLKLKSSKNFDIDHCHKTNKIRGLLCRSCNMGLGYFKDSPNLLIKAANYLHD